MDRHKSSHAIGRSTMGIGEELQVSRTHFSFFRFLNSSFFSFFFYILCLISLATTAAVAEEPTFRSVLRSVTQVSAADYTRISLSLSEKVQHKMFLAPAEPTQGLPARLVIDFPQTQKGPDAPTAVSFHDGLVKQVRASQYTLSTVRVILDIENIDNFKTFSLPEPYRLIIDVRSKELKPTHRKAPSAPIAVEPPSTFTIMLDPGHGGKDPGAMGEGRMFEKDIVLAISKRLGRKLASRSAVKVLYTRSSDVFVPLEERIARANAAKADLFVSIHANASTNPELQGVETYYLNNTNDRATIRLAALENGLLPHGHTRNDSEPGLSYLLSDLIQSGKEEESIALARQLQNAVVARAKERYPAVRNLGVKKGPFYVLVGAHMPCVLVETAFVSHPVEGKHLVNPAYQDALAEGLFLGISRFLRTGRMERSL